MTHRLTRLWNDLLAALRGKQDRAEFLASLLQWLKANLKNINRETVQFWRLADYANIDSSQYPVENSDVQPLVELERMEQVIPRSFDAMGMRLRDIIWTMITRYSQKPCPRCEDDLRVLFDPRGGGHGSLVLACDSCTHAQLPDGRPWKGSSVLRPPTIKELKEGGFTDD